MLKFKKIYHGILWIAVSFVCILALCSIAPRFFGIHPYIVLSGSMEPCLPTGSLVYMDQKISPQDVHAGDIIAYEESDILITHRIVEETRNFVITKGDANEQADFSPVLRNAICGKYVFHIPYLGYLYARLTKPAVCLMILCIIAVESILSFGITCLTHGSSHSINRKESSL